VATSKRRNPLGRHEVEPLDARAARVAALDALARRDHSSEDLRRKLLEKGYDVAVVAPLLDALRAEKLLDDRRYTENFVAHHAARGQGPLRVRADLRRLGLEGVPVEECLDAFPDWIVHLRRTRQKKFGATLPSTYADKQRQARFLGYRGFTSAQIRTALGFDIDLDSGTEEYR
jgi:regulatory protein